MPETPPISLAEAGIDKNLAKRARKLNALSKKNFENLITEGRADARRSAERAIFSQIGRQEKHQKIATATERAQLLAHVGPFPLIYADPPWFGQTPVRRSQTGIALSRAL